MIVTWTGRKRNALSFVRLGRNVMMSKDGGVVIMMMMMIMRRRRTGKSDEKDAS